MVRIQISGAQGRTEEKNLTDPAVLGRDPECDVVINDHQISRRHCRIEPQPDGVLVIDLNSRNGVYVNGKRLVRYLLKPGEVLEIGNSTIRLEVPQTQAQPDDLMADIVPGDAETSEQIASAADPTTITTGQETATPKPRRRDSFAHRQAMWEKAAATRESPDKGTAKNLLKRIKLSGSAPVDPQAQSPRAQLKKKIAIGFIVVALAALLFQASTFLHSDNAVAPVNHSQSQPSSRQTAKKRAIND